MNSLRPTGTVTFLFTDIEGSTQLARAQGAAWPALQARHHAILRVAIEAHGGHVFQTVGDAVCAVFAMAPDALTAAAQAQRALLAELPLKVRMGLHTGNATAQPDGDYEGYLTLATVQRVMSGAFGGQVLLSQTSADLVLGQLPTGATLRDLGEQHLKGMERAERLYQLDASGLPHDFPPLASSMATPNNLPLQLTSFIGRKAETSEVKRQLSSTRLLTLTGSGGSGKTRLSLKVAAELLEQFSDGVWFVELAPLADPTFVPQTVASALHISEQPGQPILQTLAIFLRDNERLLILDNCEHLLPACAQLVQSLLQACPDLKVLATSREALGLAGETTYRVPSLTLPAAGGSTRDIGSLAQTDSVRLFVERASAVQMHFSLNEKNAEAIAQICRRLDGIPLAIELAASRVRMLTATQIAARLDDAFQLLTHGSHSAPRRQQTLRAAMDWSHDLLLPMERTLFRRLAVFAGGFTLEAAEEIAEDGGGRIKDESETKDNIADDGLHPSSPFVPRQTGLILHPSDVLDLLSALVDKSLVVVDPQDEGAGARYRLLEPVRQYARERLVSAAELELTHEQHLRYFLQLAEAMEPQLRGARQKECLDRLEREHDNLRAALEWAMNRHDDERALRLGGAVYLFWRQREYWSESDERLGPILALKVVSEHETLRAKILAATAYIDVWRGNLARAKARANESVELSVKHADPKCEGEACMVLGFATWQTSDYREAQTWLERSLRVTRQCDDQIGVAEALHILGHVAQDRGDHTLARSYYLDSLTRLSSFGDRVNQTLLLADLCTVSYLQENFSMARFYAEQDLAICRDIGNKSGMARALNTLGDLARCADDDVSAQSLYEESLALFIQVRYQAQTASVWHNLAHVRLHQAQYAEALTLFKRAWQEYQSMGDKKGVVDCLAGIAGVAAMTRQPENAARLLGACEALLAQIGTMLWPANRIAQARCVTKIREQLNSASFAAAWTEGRAMTMEQVIALAEQVVVPAQSVTPVNLPVPDSASGLTPREIEVLRLVAKGHTDVQVADMLVISPRTVGRHLSSIYGKLDVTTRTAAARLALEWKLV